MALIPPAFLNCVVCIGVAAPAGTNWIGTGFLVGRPSGEGDNQYFTKLVTNRHVLQGKGEVVVRFNSDDNAKVLDYPVQLVSGGKQIWTGHPTPEVDIGVLPINPDILKRDHAEFAFYELDKHTMKVADLRDEGVSEADGIFVLGFPLGIVSADRKHVIARSGIIARIRDVLDGKERCYLIDANIFPGNSGGPVILRPEVSAIQGTKSIGRSALIGMVKSYVPFRDVAVSQQTGNPRVIFEENSGLALVESVDSILEAVEASHTAERAA